MDDFLHNLRSGKLKQVDRSNRPYNDQQYKGGPRRNLDRRKGHYENKDSSEKLNAIKDVLEGIVESQKQLTQAYQARTRAEERKARAMEVLAKNIYRMINPNATDADDIFALQAPETHTPAETPREIAAAPLPAEPKPENFAYPSEPAEVQAREAETLAGEDADAEIYAEEGEQDSSEDEMDEIAEEHPGSPGRLSAEDRRMLVDLIGQMRNNGQGWEKIARHITAQGIPTLSGKGSWRGVMVKNLYEKMGSAA